VRLRKYFIDNKLWLATVLLLLIGCSQPGLPIVPPAQATQLLPTWIAETIQARQIPFLTAEVAPALSATRPNLPEDEELPLATPSIAPQELSSPIPSSLPEMTSAPVGLPTRTPTLTPTLTIPDAAIQIFEPGPLSRIVSPLQLRAWVKPGGDGRVRVELLGEDGRLLVRKILRYGADDRRFFLDETLVFEISGVAETGRLQISTYDTYDRLVSLASQEVILLSVGENQINPSGELTELVIIQEPLPNKLIQGKTLVVSGLARTFNGQDLLVELIARDGRVVGYRQAFVPEGVEGIHIPFVVDVPFSVETATNIRLTIKGFSSGRIGGIIYAISEEILLSP
jgi:hypothetical protein